MTEGERLTAQRLEAELPSDWIVVSNKTLVARNGVAREIDFIVIAANTVFVVDEKGYRGKIHGNDQYWIFDSRESCESPLNKIDVAARMLAGTLRAAVPRIQQDIGGRPFVVSAVLLSHPTCEVFVQEPRRDRIIRLEDAANSLRRLDRENVANTLRPSRGEIVEKLKLVPPRPALPRRINLYTVVEELPAGPYYRSFKATHSAHANDEFYRVKLYEVTPASQDSEWNQAELFRRDYRATMKVYELGLAPSMEVPIEWGEGQYIVVGQKIPKLPTMRAFAAGGPPSDFASTLRVCHRMLEGLAKMHEAGVIHRNLSPDNTYVDAEGDLKILFSDFDFSRIEQEASVAALGDEAIEDSKYLAPEVSSGLARATLKSDIYSAGAILEELLAPLSDSTADGQRNQLFDVIASMKADDPSARWSSASEALDILAGLFGDTSQKEVEESQEATRQQTVPDPASNATDLLDKRYRVIRTLGEGATAMTYLVEDTEFEGLYVVKRIKDLTLARRLAGAEFKALRRLPQHQRIVRIIDANPPDHDFHLRMEYVEGASLKELLGDEPWDTVRVRHLLDQLLEGLAFLEVHNVAHRDISPRNVMVTDEGLKLIDFGFAAAHDEVGHSNVGTVPFRAPELDLGEAWDVTCDLYSAGVIGLWLLLGRLPFARDLNGALIKSDLALPLEADPGCAALISALRKAVAHERTDRYKSAAEFQQALQAADVGVPEVVDGARLVNPWVTSIQRLYRNSGVGNSDNRGLDSEFARATYVRTLLDTELLPQVLAKEFAVVLLSGNPGDGKTAFLEMVYDALSASEGFRSKNKDENGWEVEIDGHVFQANYDASESHEGLSANELLEEIFEPFAGSVEPPPNLARTILVAINDGKLREFLLHKPRYSWLGRQVSWFLDERGGDPPARVAVLDLKRRSVVSARQAAPGDLLERVLDKLVADDAWEICLGCRARSVCPMKFNRDSLLTGSQARPHLRELFQVSHLKRERHVTIRDMRSALSYIIAGEFTCEQIHEEIDAGSVPPDWADRLYFSAAFNPKHVAEDNLHEFAFCDPAKSTNPRLDRSLWHMHRTRASQEASSWCHPFFGRSHEPIRALARISSPNRWFELTKRRLFFEGSATGPQHSEAVATDFRSLLPYRYLGAFIHGTASSEHAASLLPRLCEGVSRANGVSDDAMRERYLCVKTSHSVEQDLTVFKRFPVEEFELSVRQTSSEYVEELPNSIGLMHLPSGARLLVGLDLFEILMRMNEGYLPGSEELQPFLVDLDQFEARLLNEPAKELLLLEAGRRLHRVQQDEGELKYVGLLGAEEAGS